MHKSPLERKVAYLAFAICMVIGIAIWALLIWGLIEGVTFLSHLNESK